VSCPGRSLPLGKTGYPLYRKLGWPQGWSGQVRKILPPPGFDPRTVQPVASRCTDYAAQPISFAIGGCKTLWLSHFQACKIFQVFEELLKLRCFVLPEIVPFAIILEILRPLEYLFGLSTFMATQDNIMDSAHTKKVTDSGTSGLGTTLCKCRTTCSTI
jgi:hypothetical protein